MGIRDFQNRHIVITGAAGGLGAALAWRFGRAGARVGAIDLDTEGLEALVEGLEGEGISAASAVVDITREDEVRRAFAQLEERLGPVEGLVNNAGITHRRPFAADQVEAVTRVMAVNFQGAVHCTAAAHSSLLAHRGLLVAISSVAGFAPLVDRSAYAASKHALHGFFDTLRSELRDTGVDVLVVCPSFISTGLRDRLPTSAGGGVPWPKTGGEATPEAVAERIFQAARHRRRVLRTGRVAHLAYWISRLAPGLYERLMVRRMR